MERRLAAILAADLVGYSRLMAADEAGTLARLKALREGLLAVKIAAHHGRVVKTTGDGVLVEFASAVDAVNCALAVQRRLKEQNAAEPEDRRLELRVGINVGDVMVEGDDIYGDGVNVAARLEEIAEPGGISVSSAVYEQVRGKIDQIFDDFGHRKVKNIDHSVHVYQARLTDISSAVASRPLFDFDDTLDRRSLITGGCLCGAIRYEISQPATSTGFCHCRICQRFTGAPVGVWTAFPADSVRFAQGRPKYYMSSPIAQRGFCADCGTSLTYRLLKPEEAAHLVIFTSSLDKPGDFSPTSHGGIESQMPWLDIHDDLPRTRCEDSPTLRRAWESVGVGDPANWAAGA